MKPRTSRIKQAILKLLTIKEEFTDKELSEAAKFISENESDDIIINWLIKNEPTKQKMDNMKKKSTIEVPSKFILELKDSSPEKYEILKRLEVLAKKGLIFKELEGIRKIGTELSKDFDTKKPRKDAISELIFLLSQKSLPDLKALAEQIMKEPSSNDKPDSDYQQLATFLIHGNKND